MMGAVVFSSGWLFFKINHIVLRLLPLHWETYEIPLFFFTSAMGAGDDVVNAGTGSQDRYSNQHFEPVASVRHPVPQVLPYSYILPEV